MAKKKEKKIFTASTDETFSPRIVLESDGTHVVPTAFGEIKPKKPRVLSEKEFEVRDLTWAVGINCVCGHQLDLFTWNIAEERVCKKCGRAYEVKLVGHEVFPEK